MNYIVTCYDSEEQNKSMQHIEEEIVNNERLRMVRVELQAQARILQELDTRQMESGGNWLSCWIDLNTEITHRIQNNRSLSPNPLKEGNTIIYQLEKGESIFDAHERLMRDGIIPVDAMIALSGPVPYKIIGYISVRRNEMFALYIKS